MYRIIAFIIIYSLLPKTLPAFQQSAPDKLQINALKISADIDIDGMIEEAVWDKAPSTSRFLNKWPADTGLAVNQTKAWILYNEEYLYIAAINYQKKENLVIKSLKRDNSDYHWSSDGFSVVLDPFNQQTSGFLFGVNAAGAQVEGMISMENGNTSPDLNWDNVWHSAVRTYKDYWTVEFAIPFKSLNYDPGQTTWGINFIRNDMKRNEYSTWVHVPLGFPGIDFGHLGSLNLQKVPSVNSRNLVIQPYVLASGNQDYLANTGPGYNLEIGGDAKIPVGSSLKLDFTLNPDFSTVEVDRQVTNLTRFNIFFPEKRTFFLENSDLFSSFGTWGLKPFFSRRIGLQDGRLIPILFGARLTGNLSSKLRVGAMNVQTRNSGDFSANNYTVGAFQQQLFGRTNIKGLVTNRQSFTNGKSDPSDYNRTLGAEVNYTSPNGYLRGNLRYHWSQTQEKLNDATFTGATLMYNNGNVHGGITFDRVGNNFINELGFSSRSFHYDASRDSLVRVGYRYLNPWTGFTIRPESEWINSHGFSLWSLWSWETNGDFIDRTSQVSYLLNTFRSGNFRISFRNNNIRLLFPANLIGGDDYLPAESYSFNRLILNYNSDERGRINWSLNGSAGGFYNGTRTEFGGRLSYRAQPWGNFGVRYSGNKVTLPADYGSTLLHLVGPEAEISFSNTLSWTTFLQLNSQSDRLNINSRLQWRFASMSDFYLVFNDNYETGSLAPTRRGLVFKLNYWFN